MSVPSNYLSLLTKLKERSALGELNWDKTGKEDTYIVSLEMFSLGISKGFTAGRGIFVRFYISDDFGRILDDFRSYARDAEVIEGTNTLAFPLVNEIFDLARRKALRVDEAITKITKELDKL